MALQEREKLNVHIVNVLNEAAGKWGIKCLRYEIRDIEIRDPSVKKAMDRQGRAGHPGWHCIQHRAVSDE